MERYRNYNSFHRLEQGGKLLVEWDGEPLDLYAMGVFFINLQEIVERVAFWLVSEAGLLYPLPGRQRPWRGLPPWQPAPRILRAVPDIIRVGSLFQEISFFMANALADRDIRAVMQNLAANVVWAISASQISGVQREVGGPPPVLRQFYRERPDPVDIGPNLRAAIVALSESVPQGHASIVIRSTGTDHDTQVRVTINNSPGDLQA